MIWYYMLSFARDKAAICLVQCLSTLCCGVGERGRGLNAANRGHKITNWVTQAFIGAGAADVFTAPMKRYLWMRPGNFLTPETDRTFSTLKKITRDVTLGWRLIKRFLRIVWKLKRRILHYTLIRCAWKSNLLFNLCIVHACRTTSVSRDIL